MWHFLSLSFSLPRPSLPSFQSPPCLFQEAFCGRPVETDLPTRALSTPFHCPQPCYRPQTASPSPDRARTTRMLALTPTAS